MDNVSEFGKDNGLVHEAVVTGRKAGAGKEFWSRLAHDQNLFQRFVAVVEGKAEIVMIAVDKAAETVIQKVTNLLKLLKEVAIYATNEKEITQSFSVPSRYYHRDPDFDRVFSAKQRAGVAGNLKVWQLEKEQNSREVGLAILGLDEGNTDDVVRGLIAGNHTVVPSQIEVLIERSEQGEDVGLRTDGWGNFFFVEDKGGGVSVVVVFRGSGRWVVGVRRLDDSYRWGVGRRFFSRN